MGTCSAESFISESKNPNARNGQVAIGDARKKMLFQSLDQAGHMKKQRSMLLRTAAGEEERGKHQVERLPPEERGWPISSYRRQVSPGEMRKIS